MAKIFDLNGKLMMGSSEVVEPNSSPLKPLLLEASSQNTATTVIDTPLIRPKEEPLLIQTPIFILFAEYLGYVSELIEMAEDWCNPAKPMPSKNIQILLDREARTIYDEMLEEYSEEEIHNLYKRFYSCGLDDLEDDLIQKRKDDGEDLPF